MIVVSQNRVSQLPRKASPDYATHMLDIYSAVTATGFCNFAAACIIQPSTLHVSTSDELVRTPEDAKLVNLLRFRFSASYEGPIPTPAYDNHPSACNHSSDVASYIATGVREGATCMLGPFDHKPFTPWCQVNAFLTRPKKDSHLRRVIMDLC